MTTTLTILPAATSAVRINGTWYTARGLTPFIFRGDAFDGQPGYRFRGERLQGGSTAGTYLVLADAIEAVQATASSATETKSPSKPGTLTLVTGQVQRVIVAGDDDTAVAFDFGPIAIEGSFAKLSGYRVSLDEDRTTVRYIRKADLAGIVARGFPKSDAELAEEAIEQTEVAANAFLVEHYTDRPTFDVVMAAQSGLCGICRAPLAGVPHTHYYEATKTLLCPVCSPLKQRYVGD